MSQVNDLNHVLAQSPKNGTHIAISIVILTLAVLCIVIDVMEPCMNDNKNTQLV